MMKGFDKSKHISANEQCRTGCTSQPMVTCVTGEGNDMAPADSSTSRGERQQQRRRIKGIRLSFFRERCRMSRPTSHDHGHCRDPNVTLIFRHAPLSRLQYSSSAGAREQLKRMVFDYYPQDSVHTYKNKRMVRGVPRYSSHDHYYRVLTIPKLQGLGKKSPTSCPSS
jgi:hypothetical protein